MKEKFPYILSQDYSPFEVTLSGRSWSGAEYRFGFQNQEEEDELWGGAISFKYRVEDARLGSFFSVDPLGISFPWNSNYSFSENEVIAFIELEGAEKSKHKSGAYPCPDPVSEGTDKSKSGFTLKIKLFTAEEIVITSASKTIKLKAKRWNSRLEFTIEDAGDLVFNFKTAQVADQLRVFEPNRNSVNTGYVVTNPDELEDDPGMTSTSEGTGSATIIVDPNPSVSTTGIFARIFGRWKDDNTVYSLEVQDKRQEQKTVRKVKILGLITVYRKVVDEKIITDGDGKKNRAESKSGPKLRTFRGARNWLLSNKK